MWLSNHSKRNDAGRPLLVAPHSFRKARLATLVAAVLVPIALAGGAAIFFAEQGLATGERLARHGLWQEVHRPISRYLWLHPASPRANLIAAEALVKDDSIPLVQRITDSLRCLGRIPDTAAEGVSARIAEARVKLFLRYEPMAAEQSLAKAIAIDPESLEAHLLSWKLLELTGRAEEAEEVFWKCLALSPEEQRPLRLREWYVSQFFPLTATAELDRLMGFRGSAAEPGVAVEMRRLQRFRLAEPQEPVPHAALAELFLRENEPELAFDVLDEAAAQMPVERQTNPFILGVVWKRSSNSERPSMPVKPLIAGPSLTSADATGSFAAASCRKPTTNRLRRLTPTVSRCSPGLVRSTGEQPIGSPAVWRGQERRMPLPRREELSSRFRKLSHRKHSKTCSTRWPHRRPPRSL